MVASACSAVVTVPEPSRRVAPYSFLSSFRTSSAPGTVMVTSTTVTPPAIMALTTACACAALRARRTGIRPTRSMICAVVSDILFLFRRRGLSGASCGAAFDDAFNFSQRGHAGVAGGGHGKRAVGHTAADGPVEGLAGKKTVGEPGGKAVAAADTVADVDFALGDVDDLVLVDGDGAPTVAAGAVRRAEGAGDELEVGICGRYLAEHLFVAGDGKLVEVLAD